MLKQAPEAPPAAVTAMAGDVPPPPTQAEAGSLRWDLPEGWSTAEAGGMRYATLKPAGAGKVDVSVTVLPGTAGGELANVNRWRGQIGLGPVDDAALAGARQAVSSRAGTLSVYDFRSDGPNGSRMVAALLFAEGNSWFVKMLGDADAVGAARADFLRLLETLRLDSAK